MNANIEALLELQVIDKQRLTLLRARKARLTRLAETRLAATAKHEAATATAAEVDKLGALVRQYTADVARCEASIAELRGKQMAAGSNKEYMAIINGIETARLEKTHREQSLKELAAKKEQLEAKAAAAKDEAAKTDALVAKAEAEAGGAAQPSPEEADLQQAYNEKKATVDPKFLEAYERLVQAGKQPLIRIDPNSRATPWGAVVSMNQIEQIKAGKLVIATGTQQILYV
jgi:predicted  nucleic acid-binding Zn-ribbon protein